MKSITRLGALCAGTALSLALLAGPAAAQNNTFSSLKGIEAQEMTAQELQEITGELNAYDIAAALYAAAANAKAPRLAAALTSLADRTLANATTINAAFARLGVLTPCTSSLCPQ